MVRVVMARRNRLQEELDRIVERLKAHYRPEKIILFGSLANGKVHEGSDIDLAIIKKTRKNFFARYDEAARIANSNVGVNFFVYTPDEFRQMQEEGGFFILEEVIGKGKLIYDRDGRGIPVYPLKDSWERLSMMHGKRWLETVKKDRDRAWLLYRNDDWAACCFYCQQSVEKALKAFLLAREGRFPKSHFLPSLIVLCAKIDSGFSKLEKGCAYLDKFYVTTRYPAEAKRLPGKASAHKALGLLGDILIFVEERIGGIRRGHRPGGACAAFHSQQDILRLRKQVRGRA